MERKKSLELDQGRLCLFVIARLLVDSRRPQQLPTTAFTCQLEYVLLANGSLFQLLQFFTIFCRQFSSPSPIFICCRGCCWPVKSAVDDAYRRRWRQWWQTEERPWRSQLLTRSRHKLRSNYIATSSQLRKRDRASYLRKTENRKMQKPFKERRSYGENIVVVVLTKSQSYPELWNLGKPAKMKMQMRSSSKFCCPLATLASIFGIQGSILCSIVCVSALNPRRSYMLIR